MNPRRYTINFTSGTDARVYEAFCVDDAESGRREYTITDSESGEVIATDLFDREDDDIIILEAAVQNVNEFFTNIEIAEIEETDD